MRRNRLTIAGLYLWEVSTDAGVTLWITTRRRSLKQAIDKAEKFIARTYDDGRVIKGINYRGTLDA